VQIAEDLFKYILCDQLCDQRLAHLILKPPGSLLVGPGQVHAARVALQALLVVMVVLVQTGHFCKGRRALSSHRSPPYLPTRCIINDATAAIYPLWCPARANASRNGGRRSRCRCRCRCRCSNSFSENESQVTLSSIAAITRRCVLRRARVSRLRQQVNEWLVPLFPTLFVQEEGGKRKQASLVVLARSLARFPPQGLSFARPSSAALPRLSPHILELVT